MYSRVYEEDIREIVRDPVIRWEDLKGASVLITGSTGLIGKLLVRSLLAADRERDLGLQVYALARNEEKARDLFHDELACGEDRLHLLISDVETFQGVDYPVDYIIHAASQTSSRGFVASPVETVRTGVYGTMNLLETAREKGVKKFIFLSTMEVYGTPENDEKIREDRPLPVDPVRPRSSYPISKILCENLCADYRAEYGVPAEALRLTQTFGPGVSYGDGRVFAEFARDVLEGKDIVLKTKGGTRRSYLYTADAVRAILTVLTRDVCSKERNIEVDAAGGGREAGKKLPIYNVANEATYCSIREMAEMVSALSPDKATDVVYDLDPDNDRGYAPELHMNLDTGRLRSLGWRPAHDLTDAYRRMMESMKERED